ISSSPILGIFILHCFRYPMAIISHLHPSSLSLPNGHYLASSSVIAFATQWPLSRIFIRHRFRYPMAMTQLAKIPLARIRRYESWI
ncbi:hypothetical protein TNCT_533181, partial [Trichonephila clavata]